jgi:hypothetical protein
LKAASTEFAPSIFNNMKSRTTFFTALCLLTANTLFAQSPQAGTADGNNPPGGPKPMGKPSPPIPTEAMVGNEGFYFQLTVAKPVLTGSKLNFFNVTTYQANYDGGMSGQDFVSVSLLYYDIWKGISPAAGAAMNHVTGFKPFAGIQYVYANRTWLAVIVPGFFLTSKREFETFALLEYKPQLNSKLKLYTRLQCLYNHNTVEAVHGRSYLYGRAGISLGNISFGFGANFDRYSPAKVSKWNLGGFVKADLF